MSARRHVLVVSHSATNRQSYVDQLARAGLVVTQSPSGKDALERLGRGEPFDVVVTELNLPVMTGYELIERIRATDAELPVVALADEADNGTVLDAVEKGAVQCLAKPVEADDLIRVVMLATVLLRRRREVGMRNRRGEPAPSVSATDAKNQFAQVMDTASRVGTVFITKHDTPKAVLLSVDEFYALSGASTRRLDALSDEFDALLARMQQPGARERMQAAFDTSSEELGQAAVTAVQRRG